MFMRSITAVLMFLILTACGKTGALYLPEESPEPMPQTEPVQKPEADPGADVGADVDSSGNED